ncbi:hypothetical protein BDV25DRAFT_141168 [Aspergillus avenaceus]|uniref:Uncharacterized protein n=1 Tax=Aspergillus avenaceus TaxID=36643 RepID=A0A5N6TRY1_ASPAV|nr:hypothetical protein BDV25DRAFT_141168 [Aspergillus avenaceus]
MTYVGENSFAWDPRRTNVRFRCECGEHRTKMLQTAWRNLKWMMEMPGLQRIQEINTQGLSPDQWSRADRALMEYFMKLWAVPSNWFGTHHQPTLLMDNINKKLSIIKRVTSAADREIFWSNKFQYECASDKDRVPRLLKHRQKNYIIFCADTFVGKVKVHAPFWKSWKERSSPAGTRLRVTDMLRETPEGQLLQSLWRLMTHNDKHRWLWYGARSAVQEESWWNYAIGAPTNEHIKHPAAFVLTALAPPSHLNHNPYKRSQPSRKTNPPLKTTLTPHAPSPPTILLNPTPTPNRARQLSSTTNLYVHIRVNAVTCNTLASSQFTNTLHTRPA